MIHHLHLRALAALAVLVCLAAGLWLGLALWLAPAAWSAPSLPPSPDAYGVLYVTKQEDGQADGNGDGQGSGRQGSEFVQATYVAQRVTALPTGPVDLSNMASVAVVLDAVARNDTTGLSLGQGLQAQVDSQGTASFDLATGLYLITELGSDPTVSIPFLVMMPMPNGDDSGWEYTIDAFPKDEQAPLVSPRSLPPVEAGPASGGILSLTGTTFTVLGAALLCGAAGVVLLAKRQRQRRRRESHR